MTTPIVPAMKPSASPEREALIKRLNELDYLIDCVPAVADAILAAGFRRDPGWIACSARLPEDGQETLVVVGCRDGSQHVSTDQYQNAEDRWGVYGDAPTHWMPLPPAPDDNDKARGGTA